MYLNQFTLSLGTALIVWAGFLDKAFLHTFLYRPICIGPLVGLLFGNLPVGLLMGMTIELMYLATVFVGTATPPDEVTSAALATAIACLLDNMPVGILLAIPIGLAGQKLKQIRNNTAFEYTQKKLDAAAAQADTRGIVLWASIVPSLVEGLFFAVPTFLILFFALAPLLSAVSRLPYELLFGIALGSGLVGAVGIAAFLGTIKEKSHRPYFLIGFVAAAYLHIGIMGIALLAAAFIALHAHRRTDLDSTAAPQTDDTASPDEAGDETASAEAERKLTRRDLWKTLLYSLGIESGCSTSKQEAPGFVQAMIPVVETVYDTKEERAEAYTRHAQLFLTEGRVAQFIVGVVARLEEQRATKRDVDAETILLYKSALAGPLAGIGDSLLHGTLRPLAAGTACALIAASNVQNPMGPILFWVVMTAAVFAIRYFGFFKGYDKGIDVIAYLQDNAVVDRLTSYSSIASYLLAGAFIPLLLRFHLPPIPWNGDYLNLQGTLDLFLPSLVPLLYTLAMYRQLYKKNRSPVLLVAMTLALGVAVYYIGYAL